MKKGYSRRRKRPGGPSVIRVVRHHRPVGRGDLRGRPTSTRRIKAEFLKDRTDELVRETDTRSRRFLNKAVTIAQEQDAATIAWNLATGLYYKDAAAAALAPGGHPTGSLLRWHGLQEPAARSRGTRLLRSADVSE